MATGLEMSVEKFIDEQIEREMIIIQLKELLEPGRQYQISLKFVSKLNIHDSGFFRVSYVENNTTKYVRLDGIGGNVTSLIKIYF